MKYLKIIFLVLLTPILLSAGEYYYRNGERVALHPVPGRFSVPAATLRGNISTIGIPEEKCELVRGVWIFRDLTAVEAADISDTEHLLPAVRESGGAIHYLSGDIFVKLPVDMDNETVSAWAEKHALSPVKRYEKPAGWFVMRTADNPVKIARTLVETGTAVQAEPSFFIPLSLRAYIPDDTFFPRQWHLRNEHGTADGLSGYDHAHVAEAWELLLRVNGTIVSDVNIAIIDDGFDLTHEDLQDVFTAGKDFEDGDDDPSPGQQSMHGTCCAGVAVANFDNGTGVAGTCPGCTTIPVRMLMSGFGLSLDQVAIESMSWAAEQGADIISNSWGPSDGGGQYTPGQPLVDLFADLRENGRDGKGIIVHFASGNGNESLELDGMASNENVIAIGAVNAAGRRSLYSDYGPSLDFVAPSNDTEDTGGGGWGGGAYLDGIWTTDNTAGGYNPGQMTGDDAGLYVGQFGGTSSAAPLAAGITALLLSANPDLTWDDVYDIYRSTADKVSEGAVNQGEQDYDADGFSPHYGYGRINACAAVKKALEMAGKPIPENPCNPAGHELPDDNEKPDEDSTVPTDNDPDIRRSTGGNSCGCTVVY